MDGKEAKEIPFGAFDSELKGWEYTIPEGMEARIENGKIIVREKESEDERIRKWLIRTLKALNSSSVEIDGAYEMILPSITWLEKQEEQKPAWSKDVDLEKEIKEWQGCKAFPEGTTITPLPLAMKIVKRTAEHFFELGLKART